MANINGTDATIRYPVSPIIINGFDMSFMSKNSGAKANFSKIGERDVATDTAHIKTKLPANFSANDSCGLLAIIK